MIKDCKMKKMTASKNIFSNEHRARRNKAEIKRSKGEQLIVIAHVIVTHDVTNC